MAGVLQVIVLNNLKNENKNDYMILNKNASYIDKNMLCQYIQVFHDEINTKIR